MAKEPTELLSFWGGIPLSATEAVLLSSLDTQKDVPHTMVVHIQGDRQNVRSLSWNAVSSCRTERPEEVLIVGLEGQIYRYAGDQWSEEPPIPAETRSDKFGPLLGTRAIGGRAFATGYRRQVYLRSGPGRWEIIDGTIPGEKRDDKNPVPAFESIDGFGPNDLYVVGNRGQIWHFDGAAWMALASPTNVQLMSVLCASNGAVYACGQLGIVIRGRDNLWEVIHDDPGAGYLWDIHEFQGRIFCVSHGILYELKDGDLAPLPLPDYPSLDGGIPVSFYKLATCRDCLWSIGAKDVITFDGQEWKRVLPRVRQSS
jgi:hypothetical protein